MCGICGSTRGDAAQAIERMNATMVHRGPDDEGTFVDERAGVALGARRLSIIDVANGHQPLANEDRTVWAALNGEIYNAARLRETLIRRGHRFVSHVDTEVLVHLYEDYGRDLVHAIEGMYAFAIWDCARGEMLVGRDRFGEKPLFYSSTGGEFVFASELDAVMIGEDKRAEPDPDAVDEFFLFGYVRAPATIAHGVSQLSPGSTITWTRASGLGKPVRYWSLPRPPARLVQPRAAVVHEVRDALIRATRSRMVADVPLGAFLSGGLDSTLITALAARQSSEPLQTFTIGYSSGAVNETGPAAAVAAHLGTRHHEIVLSDSDVATLVPGLLTKLDQPLADRAMVAMHWLSKFAREHVKVIIGGEGADELFGGYGRYRWLGRAERLPRGLSHTAGRLLEAPLRRLGGSRTDHLADLAGPWNPALRNLNWATEQRLGRRSVIYGPRLHAARADRWTGDGWRPGNPVATEAMLDDTHHWLPDDVLAKSDRASMLASLELRTPYLDRELAELAATVPAEVHLAQWGQVDPKRAANRHRAADRLAAQDRLPRPRGGVAQRPLGVPRRCADPSRTRLRRRLAVTRSDIAHVA